MIWFQNCHSNLKVLSTQQPTYLSSLISYRHSSCLLCSTGQSPLNIPRMKVNLAVVPSLLQFHKSGTKYLLPFELPYRSTVLNTIFHHSMRFQTAHTSDVSLFLTLLH